MKKIWQIALITLLISSSIACKKSSSNIDPYQGLTANSIRSWGLYARSTTVNGNTYPSSVDLNERNNRYTFNVDKTFIVYSINNYYPADTGVWNLNSDRTILTLSQTKTHDNVYAIETITDSYMRLREDHATLSIKTEYSVK
jgi:hypothetical protein